MKLERKESMHSQKNQIDKRISWKMIQHILLLIFAGSSFYFLNRTLYNESKHDAWIIYENYKVIQGNVVDYKNFNSGGYVWSVIGIEYKVQNKKFRSSNLKVDEIHFNKLNSPIKILVSVKNPNDFMLEFHYNLLKRLVLMFVIGNLTLTVHTLQTLKKISNCIKLNAKPYEERTEKIF